jgi:hypothetical protein
MHRITSNKILYANKYYNISLTQKYKPLETETKLIKALLEREFQFIQDLKD